MDSVKSVEAKGRAGNKKATTRVVVTGLVSCVMQIL